MKNKPPRIGVIGCGWIMRSAYVPTLLSLRDEIHLASACDLNETAARNAVEPFPGATVFTDVDAMLQAGNLDAVMVLTSEKVNAAMAQKILKAGLPVYLEKPPAVSSIQLDELIAAEVKSASFVYTAFNRRHTPLFAKLDFGGEKIRRISGALRRMNRVVVTFPHTSIHLIDSAQFFGRGLFQNWKIDFDQKADHSIWVVSGRTENGAEFSLELIPDGNVFAEYLILETESKQWELQFPNTEAKVPEGEIIVSGKNGSNPASSRGQKDLASFASMGFQGCLLDFVGRVESEMPSPIHRLSSCRATIGVIEEMEACVKS